jgi:membrane-associated protease RseP (regulator of RpoE activity)
LQSKNRNIFLYLFHSLLFILTFFTTTLAGVQWLNKDPLELSNFAVGLPYSICLLAILLAHEFGHYFAAKIHGVLTTLPYFIPIPPFLLNPFGTMGAIIRIKSTINSKKSLFDIGIAGPVAGFVVTMLIIGYGFLTLPSREYLISIHPKYKDLLSIPDTGLTFGNSIFFWSMTKVFSLIHFVPPMNEIYHYPYLCVGWFGLFVTAMNLIPVGQLDGGHILYALIGSKQGIIARVFLGILIVIGLLGFAPFLGLHIELGTVGWLLWAGILFFLVKLDHPKIYDDYTLNTGRKFLGWSAFIMFILIFPPIPFYELSPN